MHLLCQSFVLLTSIFISKYIINSIKFQIPLVNYLPTWRGSVIDVDMEMNPSRVVGMSLSVNAEGGVPGARTGPGDFKVEIDWIKALRTLQWFSPKLCKWDLDSMRLRNVWATYMKWMSFWFWRWKWYLIWVVVWEIIQMSHLDWLLTFLISRWYK